MTHSILRRRWLDLGDVLRWNTDVDRLNIDGLAHAEQKEVWSRCRCILTRLVFSMLMAEACGWVNKVWTVRHNLSQNKLFNMLLCDLTYPIQPSFSTEFLFIKLLLADSGLREKSNIQCFYCVIITDSLALKSHSFHDMQSFQFANSKKASTLPNATIICCWQFTLSFKMNPFIVS